MNPDGTLSIVGRMKDMICRGGENVYPTEIEQFIFKLEGVADVQVGIFYTSFFSIICLIPKN